MSKYYFRCRSNPTAPLLVLDSEWEAKEMKSNLEYDAVDEDGLPIVVEREDAVEFGGIPFQKANAVMR
jgi:hypothetical protein